MATVLKKNEWSCPYCTTLNSIENLNCTACCEKKPGHSVDLQAEQDSLPARGVVKRSLTERIRSIFSSQPLEWDCPKCTCKNGGYYTRCTCCGFLREDETAKKSESWIVSVFTSIFQSKDRSEASRVESGPRWECTRCTYENEDSWQECAMCKEVKFVIIPSDTETSEEGSIGVQQRHEKHQGNGFDFDPQVETDGPPSRISDSGRESMLASIATTPSHISSPFYTLESDSHMSSPDLNHTHLHGRNNYATGHRQYGLQHNGETVPIPIEDPDYRTVLMGDSQEIWRCTICGALNRNTLSKCYVCGIGMNPTSPIGSLQRSFSLSLPPPAFTFENSTLVYVDPDSGRYYFDQDHASHPRNVPLPIRDHEHNYRQQERSVPESPRWQVRTRGRSRRLPSTPDTPRDWDRPFLSSRRFGRQNSDEGPCLEDTLAGNYTMLIQDERDRDELEANMMFETIKTYCRQNREPFTDPDFPPAEKSLYLNPKKPLTPWKVSAWLRPPEIVDPFSSSRTKWALFRNPRPEDISQGVLGNCWVLSALAVIAEQPDLIEKILLTDKYCPEGAYMLRLCKDGNWERVVVDDCFPCYKSRELVFSKAHRKQLWVPLIEKALAKLYGTYEALNAGRVLSGLSILTGLPCEKIYLKKQSPTDEDIDYDIVWVQLLSFRELGFPMGASCGGYDITEEDYYKKGLEPNHAYSILDVKQLTDNQRLIRLRNPWGKYSWKGKWSDRDSSWTPQLRDQLQAIGAEEGIFWMDVTDFFEYFCEVDVCKYRPNWHSTRMSGKLLPYASNQHDLLAFQVTATTEVDISVYQPSPRANLGHSLVDLAVLVMQYPGTFDVWGMGADSDSIPLPESCTIASGSHIQTIVTSTGFLDPGKYVILPLAFSHWRPPSLKFKDSKNFTSSKKMSEEEGSIPYVVALFTARKVHYYDHMSTRPGFMAESIFLLAEKRGSKSQPFPKMMLYEVYLKHSCRILVAVNCNPHHHFTVTCNAVESTNVLTTRGELYTLDCIPPMHRQVLLVLTQLEATQPYSVLMRIEFNKSQHNSEGKWGALHLPELHPAIMELHSPRLIMKN